MATKRKATVMESDVPPTLYDLVCAASSDEDWAQIATLAVSQPSLALYQESSGRRRTPLHEACARSAPVGVVVSLLSASPSATLVADATAYLPLHLAVAVSAEAGHEEAAAIVRALLECEPAAILATDWYGNNPLHLAPLMRAPIHVVRELCRAEQVEEASVMQNHRGNTPVHDCVLNHVPLPVLETILTSSRQGVLCVKNERNCNPLALAYSESVDLDVDTIRFLLRRCCARGSSDAMCLLQKNCDDSKKGLTPLDILCWTYRDRILEAMDEQSRYGQIHAFQFRQFWIVAADLFRCLAYGSLNEKDEKGRPRSLVNACLKLGHGVPNYLQRLVFVICAAELSVFDEQGDLPLHHACKMKPGRTNPVHELLQVRPKTAMIKNSKGKLPLQIMVEHKQPWEQGVRDVIYIYPGAVFGELHLDISSFPFLLSRILNDGQSFRHDITNRSALDVMFQLLVDMPEAINRYNS